MSDKGCINRITPTHQTKLGSCSAVLYDLSHWIPTGSDGNHSMYSCSSEHSPGASEEGSVYISESGQLGVLHPSLKLSYLFNLKHFHLRKYFNNTNTGTQCRTQPLHRIKPSSKMSISPVCYPTHAVFEADIKVVYPLRKTWLLVSSSSFL